MYQVNYTTRMRRDIRRMQRRGKDLSKLAAVLDLLKIGEPLPETYHDHQLKGDLEDLRECHIESNWLLVYPNLARIPPPKEAGDESPLTLGPLLNIF